MCIYIYSPLEPVKILSRDSTEKLERSESYNDRADKRTKPLCRDPRTASRLNIYNFAFELRVDAL